MPPNLQQPPPTYTSTRDSWTLTSKSGSVSYGVTAPFSWVLVQHGSICALQESVSPVLCKFWRFYGGINGDSSKRAYAIPMSSTPRAPGPSVVYCWPVPPQETPRLSYLSLPVGSLGPGAHKVCLHISEHLWRIWNLILKVILPLLLSYGSSLPLDIGYLLTAAPGPCNHYSSIVQLLPSSKSWVGVEYATGVQWRNNSRKNEEMGPKQHQYTAVDVTGDGNKVWCYKKWYCIGTWNVMSMKQGKLEVVNQEMARVNIDILGIGKLKWTGMGEFNSDDHYIYYCGQ